MRTVARPSYGAPAPAVKTTYTPRPTVNTKQKTKYDDSSASKNYGKSSAQRNYQTKKNVTPSRAPTKAAPRKNASDHLADSKRKSAAQAKQVEENRARQKAGMDYQNENTSRDMPAWRTFWQGAGITHDAKGKAVKLQDYVTEQTAGFAESSGKSRAEMIKASRKKDPGWLAYNKALREQRHRIQQAVRSRKKLGDQAKLARGGIGSPNIGGGRSATVIARQFDED